MKHIFFFFAVAFCSTSVYSQYHFNTFLYSGQNPNDLNNDVEFSYSYRPQNWTPILGPAISTPTWSAIQTIPFPFNFNGNLVTHFKVSSTGSLTFDTASTTVPSNTNATLPSSTVPNNSVNVLGMDASRSNDRILTKVFGTFPNRQFWVQFNSFTIRNSWSGSYTYISIVLEESSNKIYIVDQRDGGNSNGLSLGIQINANLAYTPGNNIIPLAGSQDSTSIDNSYYEFLPGIRPSDDIELISLDIENLVPTNTAVTVSGKLANLGADTLKSFDLVWSADGGITNNTQNFSVSIPSLTETTFTHQITWLPSAGVYNFKVYSTSPNGNSDFNPKNDTISVATASSNGASVSRNPLLEEFTTAPCQFCPDGAVIVEQILAANPTVIAVGIHSGFSPDAMTIYEDLVYESFTSGAPKASIDRIQYPGESDVAFDRTLWTNRANTQTMAGAPVNVVINGTYDPTTRIVNANLSANFVDYRAGDIRVTLFVVEDHVRGVGSGYDQVNAYNTQSGHPYFGAGNPIVNYDHRHVLRDVYPTDDAWGDATIIPLRPAINTNYSKNISFTLNNSWNSDSVSLVAFVNRYKTAVTGKYTRDYSNRQVLNAAEIKLNNLTTGLETINRNLNNFTIYPNPTSGLTNFELNNTSAQNVFISIRDISSKVVASKSFGRVLQGNQLLTMDLTTLNAGIYFVTIQVGAEMITRKISVIK